MIEFLQNKGEQSMELEEYQKQIAELEQQLSVKEEIIQEFFTNRTA